MFSAVSWFVDHKVVPAPIASAVIVGLVIGYSLTTAQIDFSGGPFLFYNPVLFAQYVPFAATGTAASLGTSARRTAAHPRRLP